MALKIRILKLFSILLDRVPEWVRLGGTTMVTPEHRHRIATEVVLEHGASVFVLPSPWREATGSAIALWNEFV